MKTKRTVPGQKVTEVQSTAPVENISDSVTQEPEKINRISIPLTKDGQVDWDGMRQGTREKVKALGIGGVPVSGSPQPSSVQVFDPSWTGSMYDIVGKIEAFATIKLYGFSPEVAERAFTYSSIEKEKLAEPTAKVINKYAPEWLEKFKDEIVLAGLFVTITAVKFQMASMLMAQQNAMAKAKHVEPRNDPSAKDLDVVVSETEIKEKTN